MDQSLATLTLPDDDRPLPARLAEAVRTQVLSGALRPGDRLPATRALAARLGVARGTVVAAWDQLQGEGVLIGRAGAGTLVNPDLAPSPRASQRPETAPRPPRRRVVELDLRPGRPDERVVAGAAWKRAWREAAAHPGDASADPMGDPRLRAALADHLREVRGIDAEPEALLVSSGARDGLTTLLAALGAPDLRVGVEEPGSPVLRQVPERLAHAVPVPVDRDGLDVAALDELSPAPGLALVTPSHQYPLGTAMPLARRAALLDWARRRGAVVVEDDFDSELRYDGAPMPALAALDRAEHPGGDRVATLGSFAKTVSPALGVGFVVLPRPLLGPVRTVRRDLGPPVSGIVQVALTRYLADGGLRRHVRRMRRDYRARRHDVTRALAGLEGARVDPLEGGLSLVIRLSGPDATAREERAVERLAAAGLLVGALGAHWGRAPREHGLVIGWAGVEPDRLAAALLAVRAALRR